MQVRTLLFLLFIFHSSFGQRLQCDSIAKKLRSDTTKSIFDHVEIDPTTFYCLGKHFAQQDIAEGLFLIHTYGSPDWNDPCSVCRYKDLGFDFVYHYDIVCETKTSFIKGYSEVSETYLKRKIGDSAYSNLNKVHKNYFNPQTFINENFEGLSFQNNIKAEKVNDTQICVKLLIDSFYKNFKQFAPFVKYEIADDKTRKPTWYSYIELKEKGFILNKKSYQKYRFKIRFDFSEIAKHQSYCKCALTDKSQYIYIIPLIFKD